MKKLLLLAFAVGGPLLSGTAVMADPIDVMQVDDSAHVVRPADAPLVERGRAGDLDLAHRGYARGYYRGPVHHHHHGYFQPHGYYRGPAVRYQGFYGPRVYYGNGHGRIIYGW